MPTPHRSTAAVRRALEALGADIRDARRRRGLTMSVVADRALTSRSTLQRVEAGDPAVGIGIYAAVLHALGLIESLARAADLAHDDIGRTLASDSLPLRIRSPRVKSVRPIDG